MRIYKLTNSVVDGYDTYDSAVVFALNEDRARKIHPSFLHDEEYPWDGKNDGTWCSSEEVSVEYIGSTIGEEKEGIICSSFNAG